ncbi:Histidine kinase [Sulfidibacter corallicola]|uniref:histidine kinase n=1 Tax=Sulfidibacter corallicola TaxID=2818388 RepID=A0A8A4TNV1_SULCO|nr:response regulator [Sulfidibacter corallicola]QTD51107.1 response regulator [Sulfidibacter corallicola]
MTKERWSEFSLIGLFKGELFTQSELLNVGLMTLRLNPPTPNCMQILRTAAHSIKGAARIAGLDPLATLGHAMEQVFERDLERNTPYSDADLSLLEGIVETLLDLSKQEEARLPGEIEAQSSIIDYLTGEVSKIPGEMGQAVAEPSASPAAEISSADLSPEESVETTSPDVGPTAPLDDHWDEPEEPESSGDANQYLTSLANTSMLDLFRAEVETYTGTLSDGLLALERNPRAVEGLNGLMRAAHSLKVAASIVNLPILVELAHSMEDQLVAAQKGKLVLKPDHVDALLAGVDVFTGIIKKDDASLVKGLSRDREHISAIARHIQGDTLAAPRSANDGASEASPTTQTEDSEGEATLLEEPAGDPFAGSGSGSSGMSHETKRAVRISSNKLDQLMAVSSEFFVATRALDRMLLQLAQLKKEQDLQAETLSHLTQALSARDIGPKAEYHLDELCRFNASVQRFFNDRLLRYEQSGSDLVQLSNRLHRTVISSRMMPFGEGVQALPRMVRDLARQIGKKVLFEIHGAETEADRDILDKLQSPLKHLIRNALDHGLETPEERRAASKSEEARLVLTAVHHAGMLSITVEDDGRGVDFDRLTAQIVERGMAEPSLIENLSRKELLEFLFLPGFSTAKKVSSLSGRGVGLDVVYNLVKEIGGSLWIDSRTGQFMRIQLQVPVTLSVVRTVLVEVDGEPYAAPLSKVHKCITVDHDRLIEVDGYPHLDWEDHRLGVVSVRKLLGYPKETEPSDQVNLLVLQQNDRFFGLEVDRLIGHRHLVVRPLDDRLGNVHDITAASIMEDGSVVLIFDMDELLHSAERILAGKSPNAAALSRARSRPESKRILIVDDSATVREVERKILEEQGYQVDWAGNGVRGLRTLKRERFDLVISDVDMPRMDGLELTQRIKADPKLAGIPVLMLSYRESERDRDRGLAAGADVYLTKSDLYEPAFLEQVASLLGRD